MKQQRVVAKLASASLVLLSGCASLSPPTEKLATLPVVNLGEQPPAGEFILRLPAGKPIPNRVVVKGSALTAPAEHTLNISLPRDVYIHQNWVSEDGKNWRTHDKVFDIHLKLLLPSDVYPRPPELELRLDRKAG
ncbi:MAG TPA: hypothetical protein PLS67_09075 [Accumulibacter sp.]|nr:hypothetical protein [Accumulibacter sp.]HQC80656.1 hypothetical protein [Accumulibacter sp.]